MLENNYEMSINELREENEKLKNENKDLKYKILASDGGRGNDYFQYLRGGDLEVANALLVNKVRTLEEKLKKYEK